MNEDVFICTATEDLIVVRRKCQTSYGFAMSFFHFNRNYGRFSIINADQIGDRPEADDCVSSSRGQQIPILGKLDRADIAGVANQVFEMTSQAVGRE